MNRCTLIGILDDGWAGLSDTARNRLISADIVIGAGRTLELVRPQLPNVATKDMDGALTKVPEWAQTALTEGRAWRAHNVTADRVRQRAESISRGAPTLGELARHHIDASVAAGILPERMAD